MTLEKLVVIIQAETAGLEKGINRVQSQLSSLESQASKVSGAISGSFNRASSGMNKAFKALSLGALMAGLVGFGKTALDSASDLQEWQNVVQVAFGDAITEVEKFNSMAVSRFGLSGIAARKLTGTFMAMADGIGLSNEAGAKMAIQLAGLSADMASFFNTTTDQTSNALEGIFTNQTRALKQYGIVMTEANLEAFRMARGIQTAYSNMNEAQKVALRYNYVLAATANAQNDFARTSMSWANQMRQLQMNWQTLTSTVGAQLINILTPVVAMLNKILKLAISVINAIAKIFGGTGIKGLSTALGDAGDAAGAIGDNIGDVEDGLGGANKAAKKFKATIAGFDELEVLNSQPTSGGGGGGGSGGGGGGGGPSSEDIDSYFDLYDEEGILNNFEDFFQKIKDMMDADNWEDIGAEIGKGLNYIFKAVDDWITNTFEPFGVLWAGRIARVLNGLVDTVDWDLIGKTLADGLNSYIHIANEFYENFNALNFAVGITSAINSWFTNVDWEGIGQYLANKLNFLGDMLYGFAYTIDWEKIKSSVQTALSTLFDNLDVEGIKTSLGKLLGDAVDFLTSIDWYEIGRTVGEMLSEVDWLGLLIDIKDKVIWPAIKGFWDGLMSDGKNFILGSIGKVRSFFSTEYGPTIGAAIALFVGPALSILTKVYKPALIGWFTEAAQNARAEHTTFLGSVFSSFKFSVGKFGQQIKGLWTPIKEFFTITLPEIFKSPSYFGTGMDAFWTDMGAVNPIVWVAIAAVTSLSSAYGGLGGVLQRIGKIFSDTAKHVKEFADRVGFSEKLQVLAKGFGTIYDALGRLKPLWEIVFTTLTGVATTAIEALVGLFGGLAEMLGGVAEVIGGVIGIIVDLVTLNFDNLAADVESIWNGIKDFFQGCLDAIVGFVIGFVDGVIQWFKDLKYNLVGDPIVIDMWDAIMKCFTDAIEAVVGFVKTFVENLIQFFTDLMNKAVEIYTAIKDFLKTTWDNIKKYAEDTWKNIKKFLSDTWENVKQLATDTWEALKKTISDAWDAIKETTSNLWNAIWTTLSDIWEGIKSTISGALEAAKTLISNAWNSVKTTTSTIWEGIKKTVGDIWDGIKNKADTVTGKIQGFFTDAYDAIKGVWDGFGGWFSGIFDGLSGIVRRAMNGVIGVLNGIGISVPDWVPEIGGRHFGFNIPYLAKGGIITSPTLAMMGEYTGARSNPEIVAPQSLLKETIDASNGEMVSALYQIATQIISAIDGVDFSVSIGDDQIANAANRGNNAYKKRTGKPLFSM